MFAKRMESKGQRRAYDVATGRPLNDARPDALTPAFAADEQKRRQWNASVGNSALHLCSLAAVIVCVAGLSMPYAIAEAKIGRSR